MHQPFDEDPDHQGARRGCHVTVTHAEFTADPSRVFGYAEQADVIVLGRAGKPMVAIHRQRYAAGEDADE